MAKQLVVTAPLVVLKMSDGSRRHIYDGGPVPDTADAEHVEQLKELDMLGYADETVAEPEDEDSKPTSVDNIIAEVGDDKEKAAAALADEQDKAKPRKSLVSKLEAILAGE